MNCLLHLHGIRKTAEESLCQSLFISEDVHGVQHFSLECITPWLRSENQLKKKFCFFILINEMIFIAMARVSKGNSSYRRFCGMYICTQHCHWHEPRLYFHRPINAFETNAIFLAEVEQLYIEMATEAHESSILFLGPFGKMSRHTQSTVEKILKDRLEHKDLIGKFGLGTTEFPAKHVWHWSWQSMEELLDCIHGSAKMPIYCEEPRFVKGKAVVDGAYGLAGSDLPHGDETLFIAIDPYGDVTRTLTNSQMLYPIVGEEFVKMKQSGYDAMMAWDGTLKKKVNYRFPNYSALAIMWSALFIELAFIFLVNLFIKWPLSLMISIFSYGTGPKRTVAADDKSDLSYNQLSDSSTNGLVT
jgi:hypothetical protein